MTIVITSGYYNPLHVGHLECLCRAKELGNYHMAIVNTDEQVQLKGARRFMSENDRLEIIRALKCVDVARLSLDKDLTQCETLKWVRREWRQCELIFAKGGDRGANEIPEAAICRELDIKIVDGLGAKIRASSEMLKSL